MSQLSDWRVGKTSTIIGCNSELIVESEVESERNHFGSESSGRQPADEYEMNTRQERIHYGGAEKENWGGRRELNPQPSEPQSDALPVELLPPQTSIIAIAAGVLPTYVL